jgi:DNA-binding transcriptional LysR family regulator
LASAPQSLRQKTEAKLLVGPRLPGFLAKFPDIKLEIAADDTHSDIVSSRFDAGVRVGERIAKDMIAVRLLEDQRNMAVASPAYLAQHPRPATPEDLHAHNCVRLRSDWDGLIQSWHFESAGRRLDVVVDGSLVLNDWQLLLNAVLEGIGIGYLPEVLVSRHLADGRLVQLLENWCGHATGPFLYYPSRRQMPGALRAFIDFMRAQSNALPVS